MIQALGPGATWTARAFHRFRWILATQGPRAAVREIARWARRRLSA